MTDMVLPAFEMDCRDWMVVSPSEAGMPEAVSDAPLLAVLSTMVVEDDIREATGALTVGIIEDGDELDTRAVAPGSAARELIDFDPAPGHPALRDARPRAAPRAARRVRGAGRFRRRTRPARRAPDGVLPLAGAGRLTSS